MNRLQFIQKAFSATKREMLISLGIVLLLTVALSVIFYIVESVAQPDVFTQYSDAFVWAYSRYIEGGDGVFDGSPVTIIGKVIASLFGFIGIAIVAIPAGLIGSGFMDAIAEEKREKELAICHGRMLKQFPRFLSAALNDYLRQMPNGMPEEYKNTHIVTRATLISKFQTHLGLDFKDIADVCNKYPELRLRDMADVISDEENPISNLVVELVPLNCSYGCFIPRDSKITIMVTNGFEEMGTSWFGYHIALMGGFNFICKNQEADPDERDSFYAMSAEPTIDGNNRAFYMQDAKQHCEELTLLDKKEQLRKDFLKDLQSVSGDGKWVINLQTSVKSSRNNVDFNVIYNNRDSNNPSVDDLGTIENLIQNINVEFAKAPFNNSDGTTAQTSTLYVLTKNNIAYKIRSLTGCEHTNVLHMRVLSSLINIDLRRSVAMFVLADVIRKTMGITTPLKNDYTKELQKKGYGYGLELNQEKQ